ncbi:MAG: FISUMP domain-containing protein [Bacteroidota bacterium]
MKKPLLLILLKTFICIICVIGVNLCNRCFSQTTVCTGDTVLLALTGYTGSIQWQESPDSANWSDISGATSDTAQVIVDTTTYYRAMVTEGTCIPYYANVELVTAISIPVQPGAISGSATPCDGTPQTYSISPVSGATSYTWTIPGDWTIISGQGTTSISVTVGSASGDICVTASNSCGTGTSSCMAITVYSTPNTPGAITGLTAFTSGQTGVIYSITAVPQATSYTWTVPTGATVASGQGTTSITVDFGSTPGNVCIRSNNSCGSSAYYCISVTVFTCGTDSVQDADGNWYNTVQIGTQCWLKENLRTTKYPDSSAITKGAESHGDASWGTDQAWYSCPPNSTNDGEDCASSSSLGMFYQWSAAMDGSTTEGAQGVCPTDWHVPTDIEWKTLEGNLGMTVAEQNNTGYRGTNEGSKMTNDVTDQSWDAGNLRNDAGFGSSGLDIGPSGYRNLSGNYGNRATSTSVWLSSESGSLAFRRYLTYTTTQVFRNFTDKALGYNVRCIKDCPIPCAPDTINGSSSVIQGQTGVSYSIDTVPGAISYIWTVPTGATIASGQGTTNITVDFDTTSGDICVTADNSCGTSSANCLAVTVDTSFTCGTSLVQDADGNWYNTVLIGTQCWFKENMRTTKYPDSSAITKGAEIHGDVSWGTDQAWYSCPPNITNDGEDCATAASLGLLYQWSAAMDSDTTEGAQGVCPTGWHVPTDAEWCTLENLIEAGTDPSCNTTDWRGTITGSKMANNVADQSWTAGNLTSGAGFGSSVLDIGPSGDRNANGNYANRGYIQNLWTSTESGSNVWVRALNYTTTKVYRGTNNKAYGFPVRCIKDN